VRFQRVDAGGLTDTLAKRKNAELTNQSIVISARAHKQKAVIESEGNRDRLIREAEGEAQQIRSRARGEAKAIVNTAQAEAESVREVARAIRRTGENPTRYLLALKYIDALKAVLSQANTRVQFIPSKAATVMSMSSLGITPSIIAKQA
jgi:regulator of protease activity HflC (stomatin/prohibitin superfamily)